MNFYLYKLLHEGNNINIDKIVEYQKTKIKQLNINSKILRIKKSHLGKWRRRDIFYSHKDKSHLWCMCDIILTDGISIYVVEFNKKFKYSNANLSKCKSMKLPISIK